MTALVERYCETCVRKPWHKWLNGRFICTACGSVSTEVVVERREVQRWERTNTTSVLTPASVLASASVTPAPDRGAPLPDPGESSNGDEHGGRYSLAAQGDRWDAGREYAAFVLGLAGLSVDGAAEQYTRIGGEEVWARVWVDKRGSHVVRFPTRVHGRRSLCLTEVYAVQRAGEWFRLRRPGQARWQLAALVEAGIRELPHVTLHGLPPNAPGIVRTLWVYISELVAIRRIREPYERTLPLAAPFLTRWCRKEVTESDVTRAKRWLEARGYLARAGEIASTSPARRDTVLWTVSEASLKHDGEPA